MGPVASKAVAGMPRRRSAQSTPDAGPVQAKGAASVSDTQWISFTAREVEAGAHLPGSEAAAFSSRKTYVLRLEAERADIVQSAHAAREVERGRRSPIGGAWGGAWDTGVALNE